MSVRIARGPALIPPISSWTATFGPYPFANCGIKLRIGMHTGEVEIAGGQALFILKRS